MKFRARKLARVIATTSPFLAGAAAAQDKLASAPDAAASQPASRNVGSAQIQSVMVTATKRKEDASKVPMSISVIGGDDLTAQHITDYADMTRSIPNLSFSGGGGAGDAGDGPGLSNIEIRGISSSAGAATVGIYQDDVSMSVANAYSMGSAEPKFFDLDHVEVLRGPQGTLYGASSMGGTIKFITNQPDLKEQSFDIYTEASGTRHGGPSYTSNAVLNTPLMPGELALRIGVQKGHEGGYIDQVSPVSGAVIASGINSEDDSVVRLALKWAPTKDLTITPALFYQQVNTGDTDVSYTQILTQGIDTGIALPNYETSKLTREPGHDRLLVPSLTVNHDTSLGDLTSVSSFFQRRFNRVQDGSFIDSTEIGASILNNPGLAGAITALPASVLLNNGVRQFSQEVRLASKGHEPGGSPVTWLVGAYVANQHTDIVENDPVHGINAAFAAYDASPTDPDVLAGALPVGFPDDSSYHASYHYHDRQQAVFGEGSYYFSPTLYATAGLRYLHATEQFDNFQDLYFQQGTSISNTSSSGTKATPKLALTWEVDPGNTVYATAAEGFRVGGTNYPLPVDLCQLSAPTPLSFKSDSLWSYEVGNKSRFLNNRLAVNADLFYVKWKGMQQEIMLPCDFGYNVNVGDAASYGAEVEVKFKPVSSVLLDLSGGMTHAALSNSDAANAGIYGAVKGAAIPGVPRFNLALTGEYSVEVNNSVDGVLRGGVHWTGSSHGGFAFLPNGDPNPDFDRPSYATVDASAGLSWDRWEFSLFGKNLLDNERIIQRPIVQSLQGQVYRIPPRVLGASLSAKF